MAATTEPVQDPIENAKHIFRSRVFRFNLLIGVLAVLVDNVDMLRDSMSGGSYLILTMITAAINIWLRSITTEPVRLK